MSPWFGNAERCEELAEEAGAACHKADGLYASLQEALANYNAAGCPDWDIEGQVWQVTEDCITRATIIDMIITDYEIASDECDEAMDKWGDCCEVKV